MTDPDLLAKKLALVETCVQELRTLARPGAIEGDLREQRFVEHTLQIAIQAALDAASHVVSDGRLGSCHRRFREGAAPVDRSRPNRARRALPGASLPHSDPKRSLFR